jgi:hypothetical protein
LGFDQRRPDRFLITWGEHVIAKIAITGRAP